MDAGLQDARGPAPRTWPRTGHRVATAIVLAAASAFGRAEGQTPRPGLTVRFEPMHVDPRGHDQHVLTIHETDLLAQTTSKRAVTLDTEAGTGYRGVVQYASGAWAAGVDFFWFTTSQSTGDPTAAGSGANDQVAFEVADRRFTSSDPADVLFHRILEDTELAVWTLDLYGIRVLSQTSSGRLALSAGVRFADFDNDYRAVAGVEGVEGVRFDASSNYGRMTGPAVGVWGDWRPGRVALAGYLGQSVVLGDAEVTNVSRDFTGAPVAPLDVVSRERFDGALDVAIPITEARIRASYRLLDRVSVGAGVQASAWWDVPVPPGVLPIENGDGSLLENTLVFFGVGGGVEITL